MALYLEHFGLKEPPFRITPHTDFFFEGADRGATLEALKALGAPRALRDVYRRMSVASREHRRMPGFWATLATNLQLRPR